MSLRIFKNSLINNNSGFCLRNFATLTKPKTAKNEELWKSVVGLEVHAQITSNSKLFSGSQTDFSAPLNSAVSYFDASIPGTLPVLNRSCVESAIKTALALHCRINPISMFDRKHYFYADLPSGYQITQQRAALANDGQITFPVMVPGQKLYYKTVRLLQLQLEQDSGRSLHDDELQSSLVDLNRAGLPLMELVFAPDLETGEEAASLVKELILILRRLQTCSCKMEEGALRVDANVSIHRSEEPFGVRTEVKNIGSIRSIAYAIGYEINRQREVKEDGGCIINETRSWDALNRMTIAMRDKEVLQDYRFMPEPNLPPLRVNLTEIEGSNLISVLEISKEIPELPEQTRKRITENHKLPTETAIILVNEPILLEYFENIVDHLPNLPVKVITNFLLNDLLAYCNKHNIELEKCCLSYLNLKDILQAIYDGEINRHAATRLIHLRHEHTDSDIRQLIDRFRLKQINDDKEIEKLCHQAMENLPGAVKKYKEGKKKVLMAIVGEVAKLSDNMANMEKVTKCLESLLRK